MRVIGRDERPVDTAAGAFRRSIGVSGDLTGAAQLWAAEVEMAPGAVSRPHHHAECETSIYLVDGEARFYAGDNLEQRLDARAGDFIWVPPNELHVEQNLSRTQPLLMVVTRTPRDVTVEMPQPAGWAVETEPA
jgi:uncharacterized RmlC-like cupin family protein